MKYQIKLVPDNDPNDDGKWVDVPGRPPHGMKWRECENLYAAQIPEGFHMVATQTVSGDDTPEKHHCIRDTTKVFRKICEKLGRCPFGVFPSGECR